MAALRKNATSEKYIEPVANELEMHRQRQVDDQRVEWIGKQVAVFVDDPQQQEHAQRQQRGDDLIVGERGRQQAESRPALQPSSIRPR